MSPAEKFMMEFDGSSKDLRGLFKSHKKTKLLVLVINKFATHPKTNMNSQLEVSHCLDCNLQKMNKLKIGFPEQLDNTKQKIYHKLAVV